MVKFTISNWREMVMGKSGEEALLILTFPHLPISSIMVIMIIVRITVQTV